MKFNFIVLSLLVAATSCSSNDVSRDPNGTRAMFCENWGKAACSSTVVAHCSGTDTDSLTDELTQACIASQRAFCENLVPEGYSSAQAPSCLDGVAQAYSDGTLSAREVATVRHRGEPCNHLIKGPAGVGESCTSDDDCDTLQNYLCVLKSGVGGCEIPMLVDNGTSCAAADAACNPGFYCDGDNCVQSKPANGRCEDSFECAAGLECALDTKKCAVRVDQKECTRDGDCPASRVCDIAAGADTGTCVTSIILTSTDKLCLDLR